MGWLGTYVLRSGDGGATWGEPIPVNARPLKHAGCRLGCWPMPGGELLMGVYGRIRGYGEEGENESTRAALLRSDDGGTNWEYYSTMGFDAASIVDYEEPAIVRLADGRIVGMLRTHVNPSGDAKNMAVVVSDDDGFSWSTPRFTNIWGYPADFVTARADPDGVRRPPTISGCVSDDGITRTWRTSYVRRAVFRRVTTIRASSAHRLPGCGALSDGPRDHEHTDDGERPIQFITAPLPPSMTRLRRARLIVPRSPTQSSCSDVPPNTGFNARR
jgi:hypothetical protein